MYVAIQFKRAISYLSLVGAYGAAVAILLVAALVTVEIILRTLFSTSTFVMDEVAGYSVAASAFLALGYTFEQGGVIRVTLLIAAFRKSPKFRLILELLSVALTLLVVGFLIYYFYSNVERQFIRGYVSGTMSGIPQWIPTGIMLVGIAIFWLQVLAHGVMVTLTRVMPDGWDATDLDGQ